MTTDDDLAPVLSRGGMPARFRRWRIVLAPGEERPSSAAAWAGALVLVESGEVEVECVAGGRRCFGRGSLLVLSCVSLRLLRNPGFEPARLLAVARRRSVRASGRRRR